MSTARKILNIILRREHLGYALGIVTVLILWTTDSSTYGALVVILAMFLIMPVIRRYGT